MSLKENIKNARSHLAIIIGMIIASGIIIPLQLYYNEPVQPVKKLLYEPSNIPQSSDSILTEEEQKQARTAWKYFENNLREETGLCNTVDNFPVTTMWETGSYLLAVISAYKLEIIDSVEFDRRIAKVLNTLSMLKLYAGLLPNKAYNTITLELTDYNGTKTDFGIGWSAIDISRVISPLTYLTLNHPEYNNLIQKIFNAWQLSKMLDKGLLYGALPTKNNEYRFVQEGRFGYEEYSSKALMAFGFDAINAYKFDDYLKTIDIYGIEIPADSREYEKYGAINPVLSDPFILFGLEFGLANDIRKISWDLLTIQNERFIREGILTAVGENHLDTVPYFVYNTIYTNGKPWNCISFDGNDANDFKSLSVKVSFGWRYLFNTDYTKKLIEKIKDCYNPERGWYAGIYEKTGRINKAITCNTNAMILESLCYKKYGYLNKRYSGFLF